MELFRQVASWGSNGRFSWLPAAFVLFTLSLSAEPLGTTVSGKILDPKGVPVAAVQLKLINAAGTVVREALTDAEGAFILDGIDPGQYQLSASSPSFVSVVVTVSVAAHEGNDLVVQFQQLVAFEQSVTVVDSLPPRSLPIHREVS